MGIPGKALILKARQDKTGRAAFVVPDPKKRTGNEKRKRREREEKTKTKTKTETRQECFGIP